MSAAAPQPSPRLVVVFLGDAPQAASLVRAIERVPRDVVEQAAEIAVLVHADEGVDLPPEIVALERRIASLRAHLEPRRYGFGGRRKAAFEYAIRHGFDYVVVLEPDERFPPERIRELWAAARERGADVVIASRPRRRFASKLLDFLLDLELRDFASPLRLIACSVLTRVPFHLNDDGRAFDLEFLIQCRALGVTPLEVEVESADDASFSTWTNARVALGYRAHQLHLTRRGRFLIEHDVQYTLKLHATSSHMQVLDTIRPGSLVLDLGCSQGLLAGPLRAKDVRVVGVDVRAPGSVSGALDAYYQRDLEVPLEIPEGRIFDYVVCSDVIEHVIHRAELLRSVRRYLKPDGRLLISTPNIAIWFYRLSLAAGRFEYGPRGVLDETHVHLFTRATFRREIESAAFRVRRERVTALPFEIVFESTGRSTLVRGLATAYHACARAWPEMFAYQFLLEAEVSTLLDRAAGTRRAKDL